jgi:phosphatidylethanolamine/phosphatidyl-N-methylethanolamine N-methyltransferase
MPRLETSFAQSSAAAHRRAFLKNWLQDPIRVASVVPSGRKLARLMAADICPGARVVELGVGTGTLTEAMLANGVEPENLHLVETNSDFVEILRRRFPKSEVWQIDAMDVARHLSGLAGTVDYVVSGLPIVWFKRDSKLCILRETFKLLRPGGRFYQFTYLGRPPVGNKILSELGLKATLSGFTTLNLPPAFVYRFERA